MTKQEELRKDIQEILQGSIKDKKTDVANISDEIFARVMAHDCESFKALVLKLNDFHLHEITKSMEPEQRKIWKICLGYVTGAVMEELESIKNIKVQGATVCD